MQTHQLKRNNPNTKRTIVARGGKRGKTAGRGGKGQSARAGNKRRPEWRDIIKRVPKLRGRGISPQKSIVDARAVLNIEVLELAFVAGDEVTPAILVEKGLISTKSGRTPSIKILGDGEVTKALKLSGLYISDSARAKIEKAGGSVVTVVEKVIAKPVKIKKAKKEKIEGTKEEKGAETTKIEQSNKGTVKPLKAEKPAKKEKVADKKAKSVAEVK